MLHPVRDKAIFAHGRVFEMTFVRDKEGFAHGRAAKGAFVRDKALRTHRVGVSKKDGVR